MTTEDYYYRSSSTPLGSSRAQPRPGRVMVFVASSLLAHCGGFYTAPSLPPHPEDPACVASTQAGALTPERAKDLDVHLQPVISKDGVGARGIPLPLSKGLTEKRVALTVIERNEFLDQKLPWWCTCSPGKADGVRHPPRAEPNGSHQCVAGRVFRNPAELF